jgi:hypothetical protein
MTKMVVPLAHSSSDKCVARHLPIFFSQSQILTRILLAMMPPEFSKGDEEEEGVLHNFTRILLAMRKKRKRGTIIQQETVIYLS